MKITPAKDYKKPLYAIGIMTTLMAVTVTGCTDMPFTFKGGTKETEVDLAGAADVRPDETDYCKIDADNEDLVLSGEVDIEGEVALEGDVAVDPDYTDPTEESLPLDLEGGVEIDEG